MRGSKETQNTCALYSAASHRAAGSTCIKSPHHNWISTFITDNLRDLNYLPQSQLPSPLTRHSIIGVTSRVLTRRHSIHVLEDSASTLTVHSMPAISSPSSLTLTSILRTITCILQDTDHTDFGTQHLGVKTPSSTPSSKFSPQSGQLMKLAIPNTIDGPETCFKGREHQRNS